MGSKRKLWIAAAAVALVLAALVTALWLGVRWLLLHLFY